MTNEGNIKPGWTTIPQASRACQELILYRSQKQCSLLCKCIKSGWNCTQHLWRRLLQKIEISCCAWMDTVMHCWKSHYVLSYLTVMLFRCKCIFVVGIFQIHLFMEQADEITKLKSTKYSFINWASINQCKMSRNHNNAFPEQFKQCCETMGQFRVYNLKGQSFFSGSLLFFFPTEKINNVIF